MNILLTNLAAYDCWVINVLGKTNEYEYLKEFEFIITKRISIRFIRMDPEFFNLRIFVLQFAPLDDSKRPSDIVAIQKKIY